MEVSLCCISSYTPTLSFLSPRCHCVRLQRKQFLGSCHNLRPPGLRSRRQCKKLGFRFHFHSKRLLLRASLDSQSVVVVVTVAAVSAALTIVFLNYSKIRTHIKKMQEDSVAELPVSEIKLMNGTTIATSTSELSDSHMVASLTGDSRFTTESEGLSLSSTAFVPSESGVLTYPLDRRMSEKHLEGCGYETVVETKKSSQMVEIKPREASFPAVNAQSGVTEFATLDCEHFLGSNKSNSNLTHKDSQREELYTFYDAPTAKLNGVGALAYDISLHDNGNSVLFKDSAVDGGKFPRSPLFHHAEDTHDQGGSPVAYYKDTSRRKEDVGKREDSSVKKYGQRSKFLFPSHSLEGKYMDGNHSSKQFSAYNKLLRDGRLNDCIEMLEEMESKGLLDMDKVYHARFFQACKSQKAIKAAFRFMKLIPNPTLSTFNMLMSVCASSQDLRGAFEVLQLVQEARLKLDCKLYTTLISTCARTGKVDTMFKVFHEMVNTGVEPNVHTYGALIDGCAKAGQVAKAFGAYGIMQSKNVKPDRVVFNALITACGESGAVDRAFDVLSEMRSEIQPIDPDHVTVGALMKACINAGQIDRAREVYRMIDEYNIKGTPEVYTIAVNSCSQNGDWEFACSVYGDMIRRGVAPDETFISALIDVAGHAGKLDAAFEIQEIARAKGINSGIISYSSLMGACSNAKDWQKALQLYEDIKDNHLKPTVSMMNALITALCDADQLQKAIEVLFAMKRQGLCPNTITYSILLVASEKKDDLEMGQMLFSQAKMDGVAPNLVVCRCIIGMCLRRYQKACSLGEPVFSLNSGRLQLDSKWTSLALMVYREGILAGVVPTVELLSQVLGCLQLSHDLSLRNRLIENLGVSIGTTKASKLCSLVDGYGEYDPRVFSLLEEAASLGIVPAVSLKRSPIVVDVKNLPIHTAEVYILTILKGLKHRLAAGVKLPNLSIILPLADTQIQTPSGEKSIKIAGRISQAIAALLRRLGLPYLGSESHGKIRVNGVSVKKWFQPKLDSRFSGKPKLDAPFSGKRPDMISSQNRLGKGIIHQQRNIRTGNLSLD